MNLIQIITLYKSGQLPANPAVLRSCAEVLEHANDLAFASWRTTSNPVTAKMLEAEQIRYEKILKHIQGMQKAISNKAHNRRKAIVQSAAFQHSFQ
ncbi:hypothetical protein [Dyadobacter sp. CY323]|uniref:hypothetical protein n=1 Tax=Dyadobacter sp. CY323 TaxID=2907302 RepID=UPI001F29261F|nr:hypothetical protein [Dyadobacter sp. CY323]MCE6987464.1 hypothetical protein [Dyadobacter sp. CY323]